MVSGIRIGARLASLCLLGAFAACGSDPQFQAIDNGTSPDDTPLRGGNNGTGSTTGNGGRNGNTGGTGVIDVPDPVECEPKTCEELKAECGKLADGCGEVVDCGVCEDGERCGIVEHNQCTAPDDLCEPIPEAEACDGKECGREGNGCGDFYTCGECEDGEVCGAEEAFQCAEGTGKPGDCPNKVASCADAGARCGVIGDGCGGTIDCDAELGECDTGTFCGVTTPYQCDPPPIDCTPATSCAELGWQCGLAVDECGTVFDCAAEGRTCGALEVCSGGINAPTSCEVPDSLKPCDLCPSVPACQTGITSISGRVITPGRDDADTGNQVGVPNAFVYILRSNDIGTLPGIPTGLGASGASCDRCTEQDFGKILASTTSDATGAFTIAGNVPVGAEFLLVVKAGKFRRVTHYTVAASGACKANALPTDPATNPARLPRTLTDGLAVNIPKIGIATGQIDAIECVFEKMGLDHALFGDPATANTRLHLYRGDKASSNSQCSHTGAYAGAYISGSNAHEADLYGSMAALQGYDIVVADCEGSSYQANPASNAQRDNLRQYVNRGGRLFASHLNFVWLNGNGTTAYDAASAGDPLALATGLNPAATWDTNPNDNLDTSGTGHVAVGRPNASPRIDSFADWMIHEDVIADENGTFNITDPRSLATGLGASTEEFVYRTDDDMRTQQFSFNTPYGAPAAAACGRVAYSGFHVAATGGGFCPFGDDEFPSHCTGDLTDQEKVLLYMLFDLGACVGEDPEVPQCNPTTCAAGRCGVIPNGCGGTLDCGSCIPECEPTSCEAEDAECGQIGDGCSNVLDCGPCPPGQTCGAQSPNQCGDGPDCEPRVCEDVDAECGIVGDGCSDVIDCGDCPPGQICGLDEPFKCGTPECEPITCEEAGAQCGEIGDGCGDSVDCGDCSSGKVCGAVWANRCSSPPQ
jgi:hypothetical protein